MYFLCFRYECNTNSILLTLFPLCSYAICVLFLCASFSIVFFVLCTCFRCCSLLFSNQGADTDDIKCLLYVSSWNNPFFRVPRISTGITLSPPIDHGSRSLSLCFNLSIYLYVCYFDSIIARILRGVRTYITIPPIRVLFLFTKKQCHSVSYLSEFTRHSKLLKYKSDHRMA